MKPKGSVGFLYPKSERPILLICLNFLASLLITLLTLSSASSYAAPQGGVVVGGSATISSPSAGVTQINQTSDKSIINWQSYNVGQQESVNYQQPGASSISLNRVNPVNGASSIYGSITSNGQVWLVNPAGIYFGPSAYVSVAGLIATTANIKDRDFLSGQYNFSQNPRWNGAIINDGNITVAKAGLVALVGNGVVNNGRIEANLGTVTLGSGTKFTVDFSGDQMIQFTVGATPVSKFARDQNGNRLQSAVSNTGTIIANGGKVLMTAQTAGHVLDNSINMSGVVEAKSVGVRRGEIILSANGDVNVSGKLVATGRYGGTIKVLGRNIHVRNRAIINASGRRGGGEILIGGNAHGLGAEPDANTVTIDKDVLLEANAIKSGNGGKIVVWSNNNTQYFGNISATGGALNGNGGWVEVSGGNLNFNGAVDASAVNGNYGTLLLDPRFLIVQTAGGSGYANGTNNQFGDNVGATNTITPASIVAAAANIVLQANTDVIINDVLAMTSSAKTLTIDAGRSILINANVSTKNGVITMEANNNAATPTDRSTTSTGNPAGDNETIAGNITLANNVTVDSGTAAMNLLIDATTTTPFTPGSITQGATGGLIGGAITLSVPTTTTGSIGTLSNPLLTTSTKTMTLTSGSGGAYIENTGSFTLAAPTLATNNPLVVKSSGVLTLPSVAIATGTGNIDFESGGGNLATHNTITTTSGDINLSASGVLTVADNLTTDTGTTNGITLTGTSNVNLSANVVVNAGAGTASPGNISITTGTGAKLTLGTKVELLTGNATGTAGKITLTTDLISASANANAPQIGGTGLAAGFAQYDIIQPFSAAQTIGLGTGAGTLALTSSLLGSLRTTNLRIGNNTATGNMTITGWTPGATFNGGVLTLDTGGNITQGGALNLSTFFSGLLLRSGAGTGSVTLTSANNFSNIAASENSGTGLLSITNAVNNALTVGSLTDDLGTVSGIAAPGGVSLTTSGTGLLSVNANIPILSTGTINLTANSMTIASNAQIGGTGVGTGLASQVNLQPNTSATTIGINGGTGSLQLSAATLNTIYANNLRIGSSTAGNININAAGGTWSPASHVAQNGVLTLQTAGTITQAASSVIDLSTAAASLLLRNASSVTLTGNNIISTLASTAISGALSIKNVASSATTVGSLTDSIGTVNGVSATGGVTLQATNGGIILNSNVTANTTGTDITLAGTSFTNNVGSGALSSGTGNYRVWSGNPANDNRNGLTFNFIQYNATFGVTSVLGTGNGFLYTIAPVITPVLTGTISKVYSKTNAAMLTAANYTTTGAINGDTVVISTPTSGTYNSVNVGTGIGVTATGVSLISASNGAATVYGYTLGSTTATGNIGTITPLSLNLTGSRIYDGTVNFIASQLNASNVIAGDSVTLGGSATVASTNVNTYTSFATNNLTSSNANYQVTGGTVNVSITPATLTITPTSGQNKIYGANDLAAGFTYAETGLVSGDSISGDLGRTAGEDVATYSYNLGNLTVTTPSNYSVVLSAVNTFAITPASLVITATAGQNKIYGTSDPAAGFTYGNSGLVAGVTPKYWNSSGNYVNATTINDTISGNLGRASGENVGNYNYVIGSIAASDPANYTTSLTAGTFAITPASLIITATAGQNKIYGTNDPATGFTYNDTVLVNNVTPMYWDSTGTYSNAATINDTISGNLGRAAGENVGNYNYAIGSIAANNPANYNTTFNSSTFAITPASLIITADPGQTKVYGTDDPASGFTYSNTGLISGITPKFWDASGNYIDATTINDTLTGNLGRTTGEDVGNYNYVIGSVIASSGANYNITFNSNTFAITPASLAINAFDQSKVYGTNDPVLTYSSSGLINGITPKYWDASGAYVNATTINDTITGSLARDQYGTLAGEQVGNYTINQGSVNVSSPANYTTSFTSGNLSITPAALIISANPQTKVYGTSDPALTYASNGLINGVIVDGVMINDTISGNLIRDLGKNVGNYLINQGTVSVSSPSNYDTTYNSAFLTITPATLTVSGITANNKLYDGATAATLNLASAIISGVVSGDNVSLSGSYIANFFSANIGNNIPVIVSAMGLMGIDASNYILQMPTGLTAFIFASNPAPTPTPKPTPSNASSIISPIIQQPSVLNNDLYHLNRQLNDEYELGNVFNYTINSRQQTISIESAASCSGLSAAGGNWIVVNNVCVKY